MTALRWLAAVLPAVLLAPPALSADEGSRKNEPSQGAPSAHAPRNREEQREAVLRRLREQGLEIPSAVPPIGSQPSAVGSAPPLDNARPLARELWQKWRTFTASRSERRAEHHAALVRELGTRLAEPAVKEELRLHATRVAELARIRFLAENARTGAERAKLLARVDKLVEREARRHRQRLAAVSQPSPAAGGSAGSTSPAIPSSAPVAGGPAR